MDIQAILKDLKDWGMSQADIAKHCGCTQPLLSYYARTGNEPKYTLGCKLVELHDFERFRQARPELLKKDGS